MALHALRFACPKEQGIIRGSKPFQDFGRTFIKGVVKEAIDD